MELRTIYASNIAEAEKIYGELKVQGWKLDTMIVMTIGTENQIRYIVSKKSRGI